MVMVCTRSVSTPPRFASRRKSIDQKLKHSAWHVISIDVSSENATYFTESYTFVVVFFVCRAGSRRIERVTR